MEYRIKTRMGRGVNLAKKEKDVTFANLVEKIDEKWGHTYEDYTEDEDEDLVLEAAKKAGWVPS
jgi:hypothetical protein